MSALSHDTSTQTGSAAGSSDPNDSTYAKDEKSTDSSFFQKAFKLEGSGVFYSTRKTTVQALRVSSGRRVSACVL